MSRVLQSRQPAHVIEIIPLWIIVESAAKALEGNDLRDDGYSRRNSGLHKKSEAQLIINGGYFPGNRQINTRLIKTELSCSSHAEAESANCTVRHAYIDGGGGNDYFRLFDLE